MKLRAWLLLGWVGCLVGAPSAAHGQSNEELRRNALESLRAGLSFVELGTLADPQRLTPDFVFGEASLGEITVGVLEGQLLTPAADSADPRRDTLKVAINLLLETSATVARAGDSADHVLLRGKLLVAAANLQSAYQTEVASLYDATAGAVPNAGNLPDWQLPAGMILRQIGGSARINTMTGDYRGRLSGELLLPGIQAALAVPQASFDSRGNFDFSAFGQITLPPGDPRGIVLQVPPRTPLSFHVAEDGDFRVSGGVQIELPEGIVLDAFFDIDDPEYVFSLGYSGGLTFELAREISLVRPTVDFEAAQPLAMEAMAGFAQFFGSFSKGLETLLREEPSLPDPALIQVGEPPDFVAPETVIPFDVLDAWLTAVGNEIVRPAINGSLDASLEPARSLLAAMQAEVSGVRGDLEPKAHDILQLSRLVDALARARESAAAASAAQLNGYDHIEFSASSALEQAALTAQAWLNGLPPQTPAKQVLQVAKVFLNAAAQAQIGGSSIAFSPTGAADRIQTAAASMLAENGLNAAGEVADPTLLATRSHHDLLTLFLVLAELNATLENAGGNPIEGVEEAVGRRMLERVKQRHSEAVASGFFQQEAHLGSWLALIGQINADVVSLDLSDEDALLTATALLSTFESIASRRGGTPEATKYAADLVRQAEKRVKEDIGFAQEKRAEILGLPKKGQEVEATNSDLALEELTLLQSIHSSLETLNGRGLLTGATLLFTKVQVMAYVSGFETSVEERYNSGEQVAEALQEATDTLRGMGDTLAFMQAFIPEEVALISEFRQTWEALTLTWSPMVEAQKAHWYFTEYVLALDRAITQYGIDLGSAGALALREGAMEAMAGLNRVTLAMEGLVNTLGSEPFAFPLPGDLKINRAFGKVVFNRLSGDWELDFGGGLEFPESEFALDLFNANLSNTGDFSLNIGTRGEVPLGGEGSKVQFEIPQFAVSGSTTQQQIAFNSTGTLTYQGTGTDAFSLDLGFSYDSQTGQVGLAAGLNNSPVRFADDFVLLDGDVELDFSTAHPQGALRVGGTFGVKNRVSPLPGGPLDAEDFWFTMTVAPTVFTVTETDFTAEITGGSITLPPDQFSEAAVSGTEPVVISITSPLCVRYEFATGELSFCNPAGQPFILGVENIRMALNQLPGFELQIASANFELSGTQFPMLRQLNAAVTVPLPGADVNRREDDRRGTFNITAQNWRIDGLPEAASIDIGSTLRLVDLDGLDIDVVANAGVPIGECPGGLSFVRDGVTGAITLRMATGMRVTVEQELVTAADPVTGAPLSGASGTLAAEASGCFEWRVGEFPSFTLGDIEFAGNFRLGGPDGIHVKGVNGAPLAFVRLGNVTSIFQRTPTAANPFKITLEGAVNFAEIVEFGIFETAFIWDDRDPVSMPDGSVMLVPRSPSNSLVPRFEPGGFIAALGEDAIDMAEDLLPLYPTELGFKFLNPSLPLFPTGGGMGLFDALNLELLISGVLALPNGAAIQGGSPGLFGSVDDLAVRFTRNASGFLTPDFGSVNSLCVRLENVDIPPMGGITGGMCVINLNDLENLMFVGEAGAKVNEVGASVLLAMKPTEFVGACFDVNAGPAGIPLDGGVLGGILLTGAKGGINFKNSFSDPCDFEAYLDTGIVPPAGAPGREGNPPDPNFPTAPGQNDTLPQVTECLAPTQPTFQCIQGEFPPPSVNPLCEPIVVNGQQRVIFKGTSLSQGQVDDILAGVGLSRTQLNAMRPNEAIDRFVTGLTGEVRKTVDDVLGCVPETVQGRSRAFYCVKIEELFNSFDDAASNFLRESFRPVFALNPTASVYDTLVAKAAEGIPCMDVTMKMEGTFSHALLSSVLTGTGGVTLSSTGTAVLEGRINLTGIPVGEGTLAFALTDSQGNINPSFGGVVEAGVGPLELGNMSMSFNCESGNGGSCFDALIESMTAWVACNVGVVDSEVSGFMIEMMDRVAPRTMPRSRSVGLDEHYLGLTQAEVLAWMSGFLNIFQVVADNAARSAAGQPLNPLPINLGANGEQILEGFLNCFKTLLVDMLTAVNPRICFGGDIAPKIFGFPLSGGADSVLGGGLLYEKIINPVTFEERQQLVAQLKFSPSYLLLAPITGGGLFSTPAIDQANMGFSLQMPAFSEDNICTLLTDPAKFAGDQASVLVEDAVVSFGYQLQPLGYRLADGQGRVIFPRIGGHPCNPNRFKRNPLDPSSPIALPAWISPDVQNVTNAKIPTRREVILAALSKGQLQNPLWRGTGPELVGLFAQPGTACYVPGNPGCLEFTQEVTERIGGDFAALSQMDFANDYFPHGGLIGGAEFALPNLLAAQPPTAELAELARVPLDANDFSTRWLPIAQRLFADPADVAHPDFGKRGFAYFTGTTCAGQMALYVPAPNPPAVVFGGNDPQELFDSVNGFNFDDIIKGNLEPYPDGCPIYPADELLLSGWMEIPIFGMPIAQGLVDFNPKRGCFVVEASVLGGQPGDPPSWLHEMVGASMKFEIKAPDYIADAGDFDPNSPLVGDAIDNLEQRKAQLASIGQSASADFVSGLFQEMPKMSAEVAANVQFPEGLENLLRVKAGVGAKLFAFSPYFEPDYIDPNGTIDSPYAVARRRGGIGLSASLIFGIDTGNPATDLLIDIPDASLAFVPDANVGVFPAFTAQLLVDAIDLPLLPAVTNVKVQVQSSPLDLQNYFAFTGQGLPGTPDDTFRIEPIVFGAPNPFGGPDVDLFTIEPLPPFTHLGGSLRIFRDDSVATVKAAAELKINPAQAFLPFLGKAAEVAVTVHGANDPDGGPFTPFTFATSPGQEWGGKLCLGRPGRPDLAPRLSICDPFNPNGDCLVSIQPTGPLCGTVRGVGIETFSLEIDIPTGLEFIFYPGQPTEVRHVIGGTGNIKLFFDTTGRFYFDFGGEDQQDLGLPGLLTFGGRLEFGYNPTAVAGNFEVLPTGVNDFGDVEACVGASARRTYTLRNLTGLTQSVTVFAAPETDWVVNQPGFTLAHGEARNVEVIFQPQSVGRINGQLRVETDDASLVRSLTGTGLGFPAYFQSTTSVTFPDTLIGGQARSSVTIGNGGCADLVISSLGPPSSAYSRTLVGGSLPTAANPLVIRRGESRQVDIAFSPTGAQVFSSSFTIVTTNGGKDVKTSKFNGSPATFSVNLSGRGSENRWLEILDSATTGTNATFNDVLMLDSKRGWIVGGNAASEGFGTPFFLRSAGKSATLETKDGGRSWIPRQIVPHNIRRITAANAFGGVTSSVELHFEEPPGSPLFKDDSGNGRTASKVGSPLNNFSSGKFGAGIDFNGSNQGLKFASFNPGSQFSISMWARIDSTAGTRVLVSKTNKAATLKEFEVAIVSGKFQVTKDGATVTAGTASTGLHHVGATVNGSTVILTVDGVSVINTPIGGVHGNWTGGNDWTLAHAFIPGNVLGGFFNGALDEFYFFEPQLSTSQMADLADGVTGGIKLMMAGDEGTLLESETRGRSWHLAFDQNVAGWRQASSVFRDYDWRAATPDSAGRIMLAGSFPVTFGITTSSRRTLLIEDLALGGPGTADDRYGDALFSSAAGSGSGEFLADVITDNHSTGREFAFSSTGVVYRSPAGDSSGQWERHGTLDLAGQFTDAEPFFSSTVEFYVAASDGGQIVRSSNGGDPALVSFPSKLPAIRQIDWTGTASGKSAELHAVGDADPATGKATYLSSSDLGINWIAEDVGLNGSWNGIDVRDGPSLSDYESWVVGPNSRVAYHPTTVPNTGFLTFYPGELAFGFLQKGSARTLPIRLTNRGRRELVLTSVTLSGADFELAQGLASTNSTLQPGDSVALQIRYKPDASSTSDLGEVIIRATEGGAARTFRAGLSGRCDEQSWRVIPLAVGGLPVDGTVVDVQFLTASVLSTGYAIVDSAAGSRLFKSLDGGSTWTHLPTVNPPAGQVYRFKAMDWHPLNVSSSTDDLGFIVGEARSTVDGSFVAGIVIRSVTGGATWFFKNPASTTAGFRDVDILDTDQNRASLVSDTGSPISPTGRIYVTTGANIASSFPVPWTERSASFAGSTVHMANIPTFGPITMATRSASVFASESGASGWPTTPSFTGQQTVRRVLFRNLSASPNFLQYGWMVGNGGMFWRWERFANELTPFEGDSLWTPAVNQEVFGTTNLADVHFHSDHSSGYLCGGSKVFYSDDRGKSWDLDYDAGEDAGVNAVNSVFVPGSTFTGPTGIPITIPSRLLAWAGGQINGKAVIWRTGTGAAPARGILSANDLEVWPSLTPKSAPEVKTLTLRNVGNAPLAIHHIGIEEEDRLSRFRLLNTAPDTLAAGASFGLQVEFSPTPDPVDLAKLNPVGFFRFEQPAGSTSFVDSSATAKDFVATPTAGNNPQIVRDEKRRDSGLRFDGNDYAELTGGFEDFATGDFSFSIWVNPATINDGQVFFSRHSSSGANRLICQFLNNAYNFRLVGNSLNFGVGLKKTGWQHLAVTGRRLSASSSEITFWRDGERLGNPVVTAAAVGKLTGGLPWLLGAERDGANTADINEFFTGTLDDFGIFDRVLDEGEILALASKSPACGEHRAILSINSSGDAAERRVYLRGEVNETSGVYVIDTVPTGQPIRVDGREVVTPATFAVRCASRNPSEWVEGSMHTIEPSRLTFTEAAGANTLCYEFGGWGIAGDSKVMIVARPEDTLIVGNYVRCDVVAPQQAQVNVSVDEELAALASVEGDAFAAADGGAVAQVPPSVAERIAGTPQGPWMRLTQGNVHIPALGGDGFSVEGDIFVSLSRIRGSIRTTELNFPNPQSPMVAMGASEWRLDYRAGRDGHLNLFAHPPSLQVLGYDVLPEGEICLQSEFGTGAFLLELRLIEDFRPVPGFFEIHRTIPVGGGPRTAGIKFRRAPGRNGAFTVDLNGKVRVFRLEDARDPLDEVWAVDLGGSFQASFPSTFQIGMRGLLGLPANSVIFENGPFSMSGGDLILRQVTGGLELAVQSPDFKMNGTTMAQLSGSVSTTGRLRMSASTSQSLQLLPNGGLTLESRTENVPIGFAFEMFTLPEPGFRLEVPAMRFRADLPAPTKDLVIDTPEIDFDSTGAFDTGKIRLPTIDFDGLSVADQAGGGRDRNYIRFRRTSSGRVSFNVAATLEPFDNCIGEFDLSIERSAGGSLSMDASMASNFCVLPDPITLGFDSSRDCQFEFLYDGLRASFGSASVAPFVCVEVYFGVDGNGNGGTALIDIP